MNNLQCPSKQQYRVSDNEKTKKAYFRAKFIFFLFGQRNE